MFKKVVVADRLGIYVESVYSDPGAHSGLPVVTATYFFAFQIYCDFSGYSDLAIGAARIMGFDLMENFRRPYLAGSVSEFWKRWHISLSTWFRDYVYIPLGGNRVAVGRWYANLLITFVVSGLWHGANWTFVAWGALHGGYLVLAILIGPTRDKVLAAIGLGKGRWRRAFDVTVTFHLALFAWVFFRADSVGDAWLLISQAADGLGAQLGALASGDVRSAYQAAVVAVGIGKFEFVLSLAAVAVVWFADLATELGPPKIDTKRRRLLRFAWYDLLVILMLLLGAFGQQQFIYFQF